MVAVAFIGLVLGPGTKVARLIQLSYRYRQSAILCREMAESSRRTASELVSEKNLEVFDRTKARGNVRALRARWLNYAQEWKQYGDYHSKFAIKYDRAVMRPWLPIEDFSPPAYPELAPVIPSPGAIAH